MYVVYHIPFYSARVLDGRKRPPLYVGLFYTHLASYISNPHPLIPSLYEDNILARLTLHFRNVN